MRWKFNWVLSLGTDFDRDFHDCFTQDEKEKNEVHRNHRRSKFFSPEGPGKSVFTGTKMDWYSSYARGLDMLNGAYHRLGFVPKGRDEADLPYSMAWLGHHDKYDENTLIPKSPVANGLPVPENRLRNSLNSPAVRLRGLPYHGL